MMTTSGIPRNFQTPEELFIVDDFNVREMLAALTKWMPIIRESGNAYCFSLRLAGTLVKSETQSSLIPSIVVVPVSLRRLLHRVRVGRFALARTHP